MHWIVKLLGRRKLNLFKEVTHLFTKELLKYVNIFQYVAFSVDLRAYL